MFCQKCRTELPEGTNFCPNCGSPTKQIADIKAEAKNFSVTVKKRKKKGKGGLFFLIIILILLALAGFMAYRVLTKNKVRTCVEACFDALENGDMDEALSFTDYDKGISFTDYLLSSENITSENTINSVCISFFKTDEKWKGVLDYGLSNSVKDYEIKEVRVEGDTAVVKLAVESPDFKSAAHLSEDKILEIVKNSYEMDNLGGIISSITFAAATRSPAAIGKAFQEVLGPLYFQWPEQVKSFFDMAEIRVIDIELVLEKTDKGWLIKTDEPVRLIENYVSDVCNALLPEMNMTE